MSGDAHVRFWESAGVRFPRATHLLLTRARQGMVIFVPPGTKRDRTRSPAFYEGIYDYLKGMGVAEV